MMSRCRNLGQRQRHLSGQSLGVLIEALTNPIRTLAADRNDAQLHRHIPKAVLLLDFMARAFGGVRFA